MDHVPDTASKSGIGARLLLTRQALGLTQAEFAERAGIHRTTYVNYENGDRKPSVDAAIALCDTYNITLDWIFRGEMSGIEYKTGVAIRALLDVRAS